MSIAIAVLIVLAAVAYVAAPFFSAAPAPEPLPRAAGAQRVRLEAQKAEAYAAIKEAEFDYRMGKLTDADLKTQRDKYSRRAIEAIAALDDSNVTESRRTGGARATTGRSAGSGRAARIAFCPSCGKSVPPRANFCPACGRALREEDVA